MPKFRVFFQRAHVSKYLCGVCGRTFNSEKLVELHEKVNHDMITHRNHMTDYCSYCHMEFDDSKAVLGHMLRYHKF